MAEIDHDNEIEQPEELAASHSKFKPQGESGENV